MHVKDPSVFLHNAFLSQLWVLLVHSSMSESKAKIMTHRLHAVIGHFTVMNGSETEGDLVLIQSFFALLWKLFLENNSEHKNNLIYIIKQKGLYQHEVTVSLASTHNCKMAYSPKITKQYLS